MNWFEPPESKDASLSNSGTTTSSRLSVPRRRATLGIQEETWVPLSIANLDKLLRISERASFELLEVNFNEDGKYVCNFPRRRETVGIQEETWVPLSIANLDKLSRISERASFELLEVNFNEDGKYVCNFPRSDQKRKSS